MMKKKLKLDKINIKSFVTVLTSIDADTLKAGDDTTNSTGNCIITPDSRLLQCGSAGDPFNCVETPTKACTGLITNVPAECSDLLN